MKSSGARFSKMSDDEVCGLPLKHQSKNMNEPIEVACLRRVGHEPPCISVARDAAAADRVCFYCRVPADMPHHPKCSNVTEVKPQKGEP